MVRLKLGVTLMLLCREGVNLALPQSVAATAASSLRGSAGYTYEITHLATGVA